MMDRLIIATHNAGKLADFRHLLSAYVHTITSAGELGLPAPEETGTTFAQTATIKAKAAADASKEWVLADDSGLSIPSLQGWPGVNTSNWTNSGVEGLAEINAKLGTDRKAEACCVLALASPAGDITLFEGRMRGELVWPPRGDNGFGYDSIFQPIGKTQTYAEMSKEEKNATSHRRRAFDQFIKALRQPAA
jgi:XTP/dITP diphosphohydrolase